MKQTLLLTTSLAAVFVLGPGRASSQSCGDAKGVIVSGPAKDNMPAGKVVTTDDWMRFSIQSAFKHGLPETAARLQAQLDASQLARLTIAARERETARETTLASLAKILTVEQARTWFDGQLPTGLHARVTENTDGSIHAEYLDNDTGCERGREDFQNFSDLRAPAAR